MKPVYYLLAIGKKEVWVGDDWGELRKFEIYDARDVESLRIVCERANYAVFNSPFKVFDVISFGGMNYTGEHDQARSIDIIEKIELDEQEIFVGYDLLRREWWTSQRI